MNIFFAAALAETPADHTAITVAIIMAGAGLLGTIIGAWYTFRSARKNAEVTRETERTKIDIASWDGWREDVERLRRQRKEDSEEHERHKRECAEKIDTLTDRVEILIAKHEKAQREERRKQLQLEGRIDALTDWGRQVVRIMNARGIIFPTPPPGMIPTDPEGFPIQVPGAD
jgi:hypothetical protein